MSSKKTPLSEEPFGIKSMERLDIGDLVQWSELGPDFDGRFGPFSVAEIERYRTEHGD